MSEKKTPKQVDLYIHIKKQSTSKHFNYSTIKSSLQVISQLPNDRIKSKSQPLIYSTIIFHPSVNLSTFQQQKPVNKSSSELFNNDIQPTFQLLHIKKSVNMSSSEQFNNDIQSTSQLLNYSAIKTSQQVNLSNIQQQKPVNKSSSEIFNNNIQSTSQLLNYSTTETSHKSTSQLLVIINRNQSKHQHLHYSTIKTTQQVNFPTV